MVRRWERRFNEGCENVYDEERMGGGLRLMMISLQKLKRKLRITEY